MTNYLSLFNKSSCIDQIQKTQTNYKIYFLTDLIITNTGDIDIIDINQYTLPLTDATYYTSHADPLWRTALERIFYINAFINHYNLTNSVHFDNDVLIYKNITEISTLLQDHIPNIGLTPHKKHELVCGFMFLKNSNSLEVVCEQLLKLVVLGEVALERMLNSMPHEMRLLGYLQDNILDPDIITTLPVSPLEPGNNMFTLFDGVFDPSSYGQFFGNNNEIHPDNANRYIDRHINKEFVPVFDKNTHTPYIQWGDKQVPIFNLHIHNKKLHEFNIR
jgi:hypothetical protein